MSSELNFGYLREIYLTNTGNCHKSRNRCSKNCFQKIVHIAAEPKVEFIEKKIADKVVKLKLVPYENL